MRSPPSCTFPMSLIINSGYSIVARIFSSPFVNTTSDHYLRNENYANFLIQFTVVSLFLRNLSRAGRKNHFQLANHNNAVGKFKIPLQSSSRCFDRKKVVAWLQFIHLFSSFQYAGKKGLKSSRQSLPYMLPSSEMKFNIECAPNNKHRSGWR